MRLLGCLYLALGVPAASAAWISDGSDGAFNPMASMTLDLPDDGVFNFTSIDIPSNITVTFRKNALNTPVYLLATGTVNISGVIDISAGGVNLADLSGALGYIRPATTATSGPGGGAGGLSGYGDSACTGASCRDATAGTGLSPGQPGPTPATQSPKVYGIAGGAGGMATAGLDAYRYGAGVDSSPAVPYPVPLTGGSGGGGGSGWQFFGVQLSGGAGGGGGGAMLVATPDAISVSGSLLALGANGGWSFANSGGYGGPGGGGSGGNIALIGDSVTLAETALIESTGGYGGGLSTQTYPNDPRFFESGARGGMGYLYVQGNQFSLLGTLNAQVVAVPEPEVWAMLLAGFGLLGLAARKRA
ncbi:MAG: hypothetical protein B7Y41_12215 [Hydrogenophilales bacterium 28-61-23]|nr:MAG: hypothetical protein B7Y41_12215 [Hydrogenophilales bacterium 28-61-23]